MAPTPPAHEEEPMPRLLCDIDALVAAAPAASGEATATGALWKLTESGRQLDANLVRLAPGRHIAPHAEPDLDVLVLVVSGAGTLAAGTEGEPLPLTAGSLFWFPHGSTRSITAGDDGLAYLTVHRRRPGMQIGRPR